MNVVFFVLDERSVRMLKIQISMFGNSNLVRLKQTTKLCVCVSQVCCLQIELIPQDGRTSMFSLDFQFTDLLSFPRKCFFTIILKFTIHINDSCGLVVMWSTFILYRAHPNAGYTMAFLNDQGRSQEFW